MKNGYFAAVDGGGSKTAAIIVDGEGRELGRGSASGSNYQALGMEKALKGVEATVNEAAGKAGISLPLERVHIGLAGLDRPADEEAWRTSVATLTTPLAREFIFSNDAELILGAHHGRVGLGLISGTGSIVVGRDSQGQKARAGGWGHFFGDEGSGLWLGKEALRAAAKSADGRGQETLLLEYIMREWELERPDSMIGQVYTGGTTANARIARLAALVFRAADAGDKVALELAEWAARELATTVIAVYRKLHFDNSPSLALAGGVVLHSTRLSSRLEELVRQTVPFDRIVGVPEPALAAARTLAQGF